MLPAASTGKSLGFVNALFTSASATCVTGLVVVDTGHALTLFGQLIVLALIQIGGLGIMTISTLFIMALGRRPSLVGRVAIRNTLTRGEEPSLFSIIRDVAIFTFVIEGFGVVVMFFRFLPERELVDALYLALFHSISAFSET